MSAPGEATAAELRGIHLFSAYDDAQVRSMLAHTRVRALAEGARLFEFGEPARHFFWVRAGLLKLYRLSPDGAEKVLWFVRPGETFAEAIMFMDMGGRYPVGAEAISAAEVLAFESDAMLDLLRGSVDTCFKLMAAMSRRLRQQVEEIDRLTLHNATFRLCAFLLGQIPDGVHRSSELLLTIPKHDVASRLGIQPETFSRMLARLSRQGLIAVERQSILLRDVDGLRALAAL